MFWGEGGFAENIEQGVGVAGKKSTVRHRVFAVAAPREAKLHMKPLKNVLLIFLCVATVVFASAWQLGWRLWVDKTSKGMTLLPSSRGSPAA